MREVGFYLAASMIFMTATIVGFTIFYYIVEDDITGWLDSFYFTVVTTRTIGFGDIHPKTVAGKIGTILNALLPATVFMGASLVVLDRLFKLMETGWNQFRMKNMSNHTIIIADLDLLPSMIDECRNDDRQFLIVHNLPFTDLPLAISDLMDENEYLHGDPTSDAVMKKAGIGHAGRLLVATNSDTTNLFVLVSAQGLNPNVITTVRVNGADVSKKLKALGADHIIPSSQMLGRMLFQAAENPISHNFILKLHTHAQDPFIAELPVAASEAGKKVTDVYPRAVAIYRDHDYIYGVETETLQTGDIVLSISLKYQGAVGS